MANIAGAFIIAGDSELKNLERSFKSVIPYLSEWHVVTNGEHYEQVAALVTQLGGHHYHLPWSDDFAAQRNFVFHKVSPKTDYIYWHDADDVLIGGDQLQAVAEQAKQGGKDVVFLTYWYGCTFQDNILDPEHFVKVDIEHMRERLIKVGTHQWKGRLHETPVPLSGARNNYTKYPYDKAARPMAVMHLKDADGALAGMERNRRILELQLKEERAAGEADPRTLLYLMKIYAEATDMLTLNACLGMGEEYLKKSGWDEERAVCAALQGVVYSKMGKSREAVAKFHEAVNTYPYEVLHYIRLALAYFNAQDYKASEHWMTIGSQLSIDSHSAGIINLQEMKIQFAQLLLKLKYNVHKDTKASLEAAKLLYSEQPSPENAATLEFLENVNALNDACRQVDEFTRYLESIGDTQGVIQVIDALPRAITAQPFAIQKRQRLLRPRTWAPDEICYFANFGAKHFEEWSGKSLSRGIGGSETAVIELAKEWVQRGFKVTVYGDPGNEQGVIDGVTYLPWYHFNPRDSFNVFIEWRSPGLAGKIKTSEFYVDLHDVVNQVDWSSETMTAVDGVFFKSQYHRNLLPKLPDTKAFIISNGIRV